MSAVDAFSWGFLAGTPLTIWFVLHYWCGYRGSPMARLDTMLRYEYHDCRTYWSAVRASLSLAGLTLLVWLFFGAAVTLAMWLFVWIAGTVPWYYPTIVLLVAAAFLMGTYVAWKRYAE